MQLFKITHMSALGTPMVTEFYADDNVAMEGVAVFKNNEKGTSLAIPIAHIFKIEGRNI